MARLHNSESNRIESNRFFAHGATVSSPQTRSTPSLHKSIARSETVGEAVVVEQRLYSDEALIVVEGTVGTFAPLAYLQPFDEFQEYPAHLANSKGQKLLPSVSQVLQVSQPLVEGLYLATLCFERVCPSRLITREVVLRKLLEKSESLFRSRCSVKLVLYSHIPCAPL